MGKAYDEHKGCKRLIEEDHSLSLAFPTIVWLGYRKETRHTVAGQEQRPQRKGEVKESEVETHNTHRRVCAKQGLEQVCAALADVLGRLVLRAAVRVALHSEGERPREHGVQHGPHRPHRSRGPHKRPPLPDPGMRGDFAEGY